MAKKFYPSTQNGRYTTTAAADSETVIIALALAVFEEFLYYASKEKKWITHEEARDFLNSAWEQVLPNSCPKTAMEKGTYHGSWDDPNMFWQFMNRYLQEHQQFISLAGAPCERETIAVMHELSDKKYLIMPRDQLAQAYAGELSRQGIIFPEDKEKWSTNLQKAIHSWGINLKKEGNGAS